MDAPGQHVQFARNILSTMKCVNALAWFHCLSVVPGFDMVPPMDQTEVPVQTCPDCASQMPAGARFCPGCGRSMQVIERAQGKVGGLPVNLAGALAYLTPLPALIFLLVEPYRRNLFVRFHALQCWLTAAVVILLGLILRVAGLVLFLIPMLGPLLVVLMGAVIGLAAVFVWLVLVVKAFQGETFKLPILGEFAERYAARL
ncbi:MAG TPA: hypothetical protein VFA67_10885 [Candidatus Sulfotelmatobacter sp.]|nr:hypothetical protein [Candidatus Sulfotelmatobacter sp.]